MSRVFIVEDKFELFALHRALFCAKFDENSSAPELSASPYMAAMAERIIAVLEQLPEGSSPERWADWRRAERHRDAMHSVRRSIEGCGVWARWSLAQRREYVRLLLSPLLPTEDTMSELLSFGDGLHAEPEA